MDGGRLSSANYESGALMELRNKKLRKQLLDYTANKRRLQIRVNGGCAVKGR